MTQTLSEKLKGLFKKTDVYLGKALDKKPSGSKFIGPSQRDYKMYKAGQKTTKALSKIGLGGKTIPSKSKALVTAKTAAKFRKLAPLAKVARIAKAATPLALGFEAANLAYKVATRTPEQKARAKAIKTKLSKKSTKQSHADLLKMRFGGDTMLKNPKKADLDKDGKLSSYEKKRGKAIESNMMKARVGRSVETVGSKMAKNQNMRKTLITKLRGAQIGPKEESELKRMTNQDLRDKLREKKMMKASMGMEAKSTKGFGAARTSGMGLQDEQLPPGKSLDYYKDIM